MDHHQASSALLFALRQLQQPPRRRTDTNGKHFSGKLAGRHIHQICGWAGIWFDFLRLPTNPLLPWCNFLCLSGFLSPWIWSCFSFHLGLEEGLRWVRLDFVGSFYLFYFIYPCQESGCEFNVANIGFVCLLTRCQRSQLSLSACLVILFYSDIT